MEILPGTYTPLLVIASIVVAVLSAFVAIATVSRTCSSENAKWNTIWAMMFGSSMGLGIWSMHFIGMMAFDLPVLVHYDIPLTVASLLLAIAACSIAILPCRSRGQVSSGKILYMGGILGLGIAGMHYTGMAAMHMDANLSYSPVIVILSIIIAIVAASAALFIINQVKDAKIFSQIKLKFYAAIVMGLAVSSMHYSAMFGVVFYKVEQGPFSGFVDPHFLAVAVVVITLLMLVGTFVAALLDEAYCGSRKSEKRAKQRADIDEALFAVLGVSLVQRPLNETLEMILDILLDIHWLAFKKQGSIFLADDQGERLHMVADKNLGPALEALCRNIEFGHCLCGLAAQSRQVIHRSCLDHDHTIQPEGMEPHGHFCVPVMDKGLVIAVINLYVAHGHQASQLESRFLESVSHVIAGIIKRKHMEERLERMSFEDELTKLPNRTLLLDRLTSSIKEARRYTRKVSALFVDLDGFKAINDTFGHQVGDMLLIEVAARLKSRVRDIDTVARIGGDEFVVVLNHSGEQRGDASIVAKKIIAELEAPFVLNGEECFIGCSIGVAEYPTDAKLPDVLLRKADEAMYAVKNAGKNNFIHYSNEWSHVLSMSNPEIDQEHFQLIESLNSLHNKIEGRGTKDEVLLMLHNIFDDAVVHFAHEEKLFAEKAYPDAQAHAFIHREATKVLKRSVRMVELESSRQKWVEICLQIKELLIDHVLKEDVKYINYLRTI